MSGTDFRTTVLEEANTVILAGEIDEDHVEQVISALKLADSRASGKALEHRPPYINFLIFSHGGSVAGAFAIADFMEMIETPVHTFALGMCYSAATLLAAAGERGHRYAAPGTWFYLHRLEGGIPGTADEVKAYAGYLERLEEAWFQRLARYITPEDGDVEGAIARIKELHGKDTWLTAEEAKKLGIIDEIYTPSAARTLKEKLFHLFENLGPERGEFAYKVLEAFASLTDEELIEIAQQLEEEREQEGESEGKEGTTEKESEANAEGEEPRS